MNLFILILAFITSCGNTNNTANTDSPAATPNPVEAIPAPENEDATQNMIVGKFTKEDLQQAPFVTWFNQGYEDYTTSAETMATIKNNISDYEIVGFVGTWCPDSRREIPVFYKVLEEAGYDMSKLTMIGVTRSKKSKRRLSEVRALSISSTSGVISLCRLNRNFAGF